MTSTAIVQAACQGQETCSIAATNGVFGDPCGGTYKYLTVNYNCGAEGEPAPPPLPTASKQGKKTADARGTGSARGAKG
eukprot:COSAG06_NODE_53462_length_300_cov_0.472637_1_plen_78_part_01